MKTIYKFLIVCSIFLFSFQQCDEYDGEANACFGKSAANGGVCCYYKGIWKTEPTDYSARCAEFLESDVYEHRKEVQKKLLAGTYWSKTTYDSEMMSYLNSSTFRCPNDSSSSVTIGLLTFVSLLFLLL